MGAAEAASKGPCWVDEMVALTVPVLALWSVIGGVVVMEKSMVDWMDWWGCWLVARWVPMASQWVVHLEWMA